MWPTFHTNRRTGSNKKRRLLLHNLTDVWAMLFVQMKNGYSEKIVRNTLGKDKEYLKGGYRRYFIYFILLQAMSPCSFVC